MSSNRRISVDVRGTMLHYARASAKLARDAAKQRRYVLGHHLP